MIITRAFGTRRLLSLSTLRVLLGDEAPRSTEVKFPSFSKGCCHVQYVITAPSTTGTESSNSSLPNPSLKSLPHSIPSSNSRRTPSIAAAAPALSAQRGGGRIQHEMPSSSERQHAKLI